MNLLPKSSEEFGSKDYWDYFFSERGEKGFDWYGEYTDLCEYLHKYIKFGDKILVAGCGNSAVSSNLYKVGFKQITNIDISETVIKRMKEKYNSEFNDMKWIQGDLFNTEFEPDAFSCVLDKGTLDAIMSGNREKAISDSKLYFKELRRIMRLGGRYICISLLQDYILSSLLEWFPQNGWFIRVCRCREAEKSEIDRGKFSLPIFMIICTKFKVLDNFKPVIELNLEEGQLVRADSKKVKDAVKSIQQFAFIKRNIRNKLIPNNEINLDLYDQKDGKKRFTLFIVDSLKTTNKCPFAVFIVPHGRETEYLFGTSEGQHQLAEKAMATRLIIVHLMREQVYGEMSDVQKELEPKILELSPPRLPEYFKIPFLSVGSDLGERKEIFRGNSKISGDYVVEDVKVLESDDYLRRLIFLQNQNLIQSEARIKCGKKKKKSNNIEPRLTLDPTYLACMHHSFMLTSFQYTSYNASSLLIGLGGGALATYIHKYFPKVDLLVVDIDEEIVNVAKTWFNFKTDSNLRCEVDDGIKFIEKAVSAGTKYDVIMFDVDSKELEGLSCPPKQFVEENFLKNVSKCLHENGLFTLNLVCRNDNIRKGILKDLKAIFPMIFCVSVPEEVNMVLFCQSSTTAQTTEKVFKRKLVELNKYLIFQMKQKDDVLKICDMLNNFKVL